MRAAEDGGTALPDEFQERMREQLGDGYADFLSSYEKERTYGLRYNPLKIGRDAFLAAMEAHGITVEPVEWADEGFYYEPDARPGRLPLHEAGAYYIQEPSAMSVAGLLDARPGDTVLDLCAAPGGKSTQIAGRLRGQGMLVSNEVVAPRARALSQNIERLGVTNAVVLNETTGRLAARFPCCFDRIVVDAPCSGEGMFRKDENARGEWSPGQVEFCARRQRAILADAVSMLKPGGVLVYSTCTFAPEEDGDMARWLVREYPGLALEREILLLPHLQRGEGHYAARFRKEGADCVSPAVLQRDGSESGAFPDSRRKKAKERRQPHGPRGKKGDGQPAADRQDMLACFGAFCRDTLTDETTERIFHRIDEGRLYVFKGQMYLLPQPGLCLDGLRTVRPGLELGSVQRGRFEPAHALAMALGPSRVQRCLELSEPERYLRGEAVLCGLENGWAIAAVEGCSAGWGKVSGGVFKNHYPKGLRKELYVNS